MKYYFGFRLDEPTGRWMAAGPFETYEEAKITYYNVSGRELSPPFLAETQAKAEAILGQQLRVRVSDGR